MKKNLMVIMFALAVLALMLLLRKGADSNDKVSTKTERTQISDIQLEDSTLSKVVLEERMQTKALTMLNQIYDTEINVWGIVVDEDNNILQGAEVECYLYNSPPIETVSSGSKKINLKTNKDGRFKVVGEKGAALHLKATKDGYVLSRSREGQELNRLSIDHLSIKNGFLSSYNTPIKLILRKQSPRAKLESIKAKRNMIPNDGSPTIIQLKGINDSIEIVVKCWSAAPDPFNYDKYDWSAEIYVKGAKLKSIKNDFLDQRFIAPKDGYSSSIRINMTKEGDKRWSRESYNDMKYFWVLFDNGEFAKAEIEINTGRKHFVDAEILLNLDGTNSFEE